MNMQQETPSGGETTRAAVPEHPLLTVPDGADEFRFYCADACGRMGFELEAIPFFVAAYLDECAKAYDDVAIEYDRQAKDPVRDERLHLTGKAIGYERAARDLRLRAMELRGDA